MNKQLIVIVSLAVSPLMATDKRFPLVITLPNSATVADVVASTVNGRTGFNIPLAPQFTHRGFFSAFPKGMKEYPALVECKHGTLTTAAMVRFIQKSPYLFSNRDQRAAYKKMLTDALKAHVTWYATKKEADLHKLHAAQNAVFERLQELELANPATKKRLEEILSTSSSAFDPALRLLKHVCTTPAAQIELQLASGKTNSHMQVIARIKPNATTQRIDANAKFFVCSMATAIATGLTYGVLATDASNNGWDQEAEVKRDGVIYKMMYAAGALCLIDALLSFTDLGLTPEPGDGIKVSINLA